MDGPERIGVTTYPVTGAPLPVPGASQVTVALRLPGRAATPRGGDGVPTVTGGDASDAGPTPAAFIAATVNV